MTLRTIARLALGGVLLVAAAAPASATSPGENGKILYFRYRADLSGQSWRTILPDGTGGAVAGLPASAQEPVWSPDGTSLAYSTGGGDSIKVFVLDPVTQDRSLVVSSADLPDGLAYIDGIAFGPSGDQLALCGIFRPGFVPRLFTVGTDGSDLTMISGDRPLCSPDWSSTDRIVATIDDERARVFTLDPDGTDVDLVVRLPRPKTDRIFLGLIPSWAPDGGSIALRAQAGARRSDIWLVDADGSNLRRVTDTRKRWEWDVAFAPDGGSLVVAVGGRDVFDFSDLWIVNLGGGRTRLTDTARFDEAFGLSWQAI